MALSDDDRDALIRTVIGEAGNQPALGQAAVAHVVLNRVAKGGFPGGKTISGVVHAPSQFNAWDDPKGAANTVSATSPEYQAVGHVVDGVISGAIPDPTYGAPNYLNPDIVQAKTGKLPNWAQGQGQRIGQHVFYGGSPPPATTSGQAAAQEASPAPGKTGVMAAPSSGTPATALALNDTPPAAGKPDILSQWGVDISPSKTGGTSPGSRDILDQWGIDAAQPAAATDAKGVLGVVNGARTPAQGAQSVGAAQSQADVTASGQSSARDQSGGLVGRGLGAVGVPTETAAKIGNALTTGGYGMLRGGRDILDTGVEGIDYGLAKGAQFLTDKGILPQGAADAVQNLATTTKAGDVADRQAFEKTYAGNAPAQIGRVVGQVVGTLPISGAVGMGTKLLGEGVAAAAPAVARMGISKLFGAGVEGAAQGTAAAAATSSASDQPLGDQLKEGALLGAGIGGALHLGGSALFGSTGAPAEVQRLAALARDKYGIPISGPQIAGTPAAKFLESTVLRAPGSGGAAVRDAQQAAFNQGVANSIGENADKLTPDVMDAAKTRLGGVFDSVAQRTPKINFDQPFANDLRGTLSDAKQVLTDDEFKRVLTQAQNIAAKMQPGMSPGQHFITGDVYAALTRKGAPLDQLMTSGDTNLRYYAGEVRDALDGMLERSAPPDVVSDLRTARQQYRSMKTIEGLAASAPTGDISPAKLMAAVTKNYKGNSGKAYGGGGDLAELADIGQRFLKEAPSSGTAERLLTAEGLGKLGIGVFGALAAEQGPAMAAVHTLGALGSLGVAAGTGRLANKALQSRWLATRLLRGPGATPPAQRLLTGAAGLPATRLLMLPPKQGEPGYAP